MDGEYCNNLMSRAPYSHFVGDLPSGNGSTTEEVYNTQDCQNPIIQLVDVAWSVQVIRNLSVAAHFTGCTRIALPSAESSTQYLDHKNVFKPHVQVASTISELSWRVQTPQNHFVSKPSCNCNIAEEVDNTQACQSCIPRVETAPTGSTCSKPIRWSGCTYLTCIHFPIHKKVSNYCTISSNNIEDELETATFWCQKRRTTIL